MDGHDYGHETYYGEETAGGAGVDNFYQQDGMLLPVAEQHIPPPLRSNAERKVKIDVQNTDGASSDDEEDEEEARDNVADADDPLVITVQFEIKILCAKEILLRDGIHLKIQCTRGEQKSQTNTKLLKSNTVYFQQKVVMKTTLEKPPGVAKYGKKELVMRLVRVDDKTVLGQAVIDLADYAKCLERRLFSTEL